MMEDSNNNKIPESSEEYDPCSPEYSPSFSVSSPTPYVPDDEPPVYSDALKSCQNMINHEPGGVLLSTLLSTCKGKNGESSLLRDLTQLCGIDVVCYPSPPSFENSISMISRFLKTFRDNEAAVFDVRAQFPRIREAVWSDILKSRPFRIYHYGSKQYIRLEDRSPRNNKKRKTYPYVHKK